MEPQEKKMLRELKAQIECDKNFPCVTSALRNLCKGRLHIDSNILECLEGQPGKCKFALPGESLVTCTCPLRKYIARNFARLIAGSAHILLGDESKPFPK